MTFYGVHMLPLQWTVYPTKNITKSMHGNASSKSMPKITKYFYYYGFPRVHAYVESDVVNMED